MTKLLDTLINVLNEENLSSDIEVQKKDFLIQGMVEELDNYVKLKLDVSCSPIELKFKTKEQFGEISKSQMDYLGERLKTAIEKVIDQFYENMEGKMASYGLEKEE